MIKNEWLNQLLKKLNITALNEMQEAVLSELETHPSMIIEAPTGSGKSLAFLAGTLPLMDVEKKQLQGLILVPTRELAIQLESVVRQGGLGIKVHAFYGGYAGQEDRKRLEHMPSLLIGTPGRIASLIDRGHLSLEHLKFLIIDEYDKMLELGFEEEMKFIRTSFTHHLKRLILTSATHLSSIPSYLSEVPVKSLVFETETNAALKKFALITTANDRENQLIELLKLSGKQHAIIFCTYKEDIIQLCEDLSYEGLNALPFHGDMEQFEREESLIQFRTGSSRILVASDLAARGLDIPSLDLVIHYQLPLSATSDTHRNGRTARMNAKGSCLYLAGHQKEIPDFLDDLDWTTSLPAGEPPFENEVVPCEMATLRFSAGRQNKISKGDVVGFMTKDAGIPGDALGLITLRPKSTYIGVQRQYMKPLLKKFKTARIKKSTVKIRSL